MELADKTNGAPQRTVPAPGPSNHEQETSCSERRKSQSQSHSSSEESEAISFENLAIEIPPEGSTFERPPDGGCSAWGVVFSCSIISTCCLISLELWKLVLQGIQGDVRSVYVKKRIEGIDEAFKIIPQLSGPFAAIIMARHGYRITSCVGGLLTMFGFFLASFIDVDSTGLLGICIGVAGVGIGLLELSALVPILEYFSKKRMRALVISSFTVQLLVLAVALTKELVFTESPGWRNLLRFLMIPAVVSVIAGLTLTDLKITMADDRSQTFTGTVVGVNTWELFRNSMFYLLLTALFSFQFGSSLMRPDVMMSMIESMDGGNIIVYTLLVLAFVLSGYIIAWLIKRGTRHSKSAIRVMFFVLGMSALTEGSAGYIAIKADAVELVIPLSGIFFAVFACINTLLDSFVPEMFGPRNVRIVEGFIAFVTGLATLLVNVLPDTPYQRRGTWETGFQSETLDWKVYVYIPLFILAGLMCLFSLLCKTQETTVAVESEDLEMNEDALAGHGGKGGETSTRNREGKTREEGETTDEEGGSTKEERETSDEEEGITHDDAGTTNEKRGTTHEKGGTTLGEGGATLEKGGTTGEKGGTTLEEGGATLEEGGTTDEKGGTTLEEGGTTDEKGGTTLEEGGATLEERGATLEEGWATHEEHGHV